MSDTALSKVICLGMCTSYISVVKVIWEYVQCLV